MGRIQKGTKQAQSLIKYLETGKFIIFDKTFAGTTFQAIGTTFPADKITSNGGTMLVGYKLGKILKISNGRPVAHNVGT